MSSLSLLLPLREARSLLEWRQLVLKRDNYTCQECGSTEDLEAHHILGQTEFPELRLIISNGRTLCFKCHRRSRNYELRARPQGENSLYINPATRRVYIPTDIARRGFVGKLDIYTGVYTATIAHPEASLEDIERSLELVLRDIELRMAEKPKEKE